jgi:NAD(P)-dependent dehydrogenase (short-subunit alcohol dehydrogenase family)
MTADRDTVLGKPPFEPDERAMTDSTLAGRTVLITGASRGIGAAIGAAAGARGANVVLLAKTDDPHATLPGTVHTAAAEVVRRGGQALAVVGDVRDAEDTERAVASAVSRFGGLDVVVNNASAIMMAGSRELPLKRFDLLQDVNVRGTWTTTTAALPYLLDSPDGRIITVSPPINLAASALGAFPGYLVSKYGMTLLTLGWAHEFAERLTATCLWPGAPVATAGTASLFGPDRIDAARSPEVMADAAMTILESDRADVTGRCFIDDELLRSAGLDVGRYGGTPGALPPDVFRLSD